MTFNQWFSVIGGALLIAIGLIRLVRGANRSLGWCEICFGAYVLLDLPK